MVGPIVGLPEVFLPRYKHSWKAHFDNKECLSALILKPYCSPGNSLLRLYKYKSCESVSPFFAQKAPGSFHTCFQALGHRILLTLNIKLPPGLQGDHLQRPNYLLRYQSCILAAVL